MAILELEDQIAKENRCSCAQDKRGEPENQNAYHGKGSKIDTA